MKKIKIYGRPFFALVDDEDFEFLSRFDWWGKKSGSGKTWYARTKVNGKSVTMHQLLVPNVENVDHKDGHGLNNQKDNLRPASHGQNRQNTFKQRGPNTSIYKGVSWCKSTSKWKVWITLNDRKFYLGSFKSEIAAAKVYNKAAKELFGEFANLNIFEEKDGTNTRFH